MWSALHCFMKDGNYLQQDVGTWDSLIYGRFCSSDLTTHPGVTPVLRVMPTHISACIPSITFPVTINELAHLSQKISHTFLVLPSSSIKPAIDNTDDLFELG